MSPAQNHKKCCDINHWDLVYQKETEIFIYICLEDHQTKRRQNMDEVWSYLFKVAAANSQLLHTKMQKI